MSGANQNVVVVNNQVEKKKVNHILHLLLTVFTGGFWLPIWIFLIIFKR